MDFMKILKSLEQALYEVMVWLVFYPLTMWRVITRPGEMMAYADDELDDEDEDRYSDKLSPPIFLAITLALSHLLEIATGQFTRQEGFLGDERNLLAFRMIVFSVFPLVLSVRLLRRQGIALDRKTLRPPFYAQCYVAAPWALVSGSAVLVAVSLRGETVEALGIALAAIAAACVWYLALQARWFARMLSIGIWRGFGLAVLTFVQATVLVLLLGTLVTEI
ncbi:hypothetical protein GCM10010923_06450 [Blastomonas marina]|uniref:Permease n=1 Tax=Blastomonas marina TaxID=1867408 RepID=A0ABQ1F728_9SPHN|nr:permease [Blastomonas marina]GGA00594.1 hypothetical protein GCM10010923_06450 [Blastomonas marina]